MTRSERKTTAKRAPDATFRSDRLLVQTSLLLLLAVKMPDWTSISAPVPNANVAAEVPQRARLAPVLTSVPAPRKVAVA